MAIFAKEMCKRDCYNGRALKAITTAFIHEQCSERCTANIAKINTATNNMIQQNTWLSFLWSR